MNEYVVSRALSMTLILFVSVLWDNYRDAVDKLEKLGNDVYR